MAKLSTSTAWEVIRLSRTIGEDTTQYVVRSDGVILKNEKVGRFNFGWKKLAKATANGGTVAEKIELARGLTTKGYTVVSYEPNEPPRHRYARARQRARREL